MPNSATLTLAVLSVKLLLCSTTGCAVARIRVTGGADPHGHAQMSPAPGSRRGDVLPPCHPALLDAGHRGRDGCGAQLARLALLRPDPEHVLPHPAGGYDLPDLQHGHDLGHHHGRGVAGAPRGAARGPGQDRSRSAGRIRTPSRAKRTGPGAAACGPDPAAPRGSCGRWGNRARPDSPATPSRYGRNWTPPGTWRPSCRA